VALELAAAGVNVLVNDLNPDATKKVVEEIVAAGGKAVAVVGDVGKPEDVKAAVATAVTTFGALNLAINNAGVIGPRGDLADLEVDDYLKLIDINLNSVFYGMKYEIPEMLKAGGGDR
jgi:NAD(P)-dependent dehydrogenase (short-subunit alcohol dehydrogenase family)